MITVSTILDFWFKEAGAKKWYNGGDAFDAQVRNKFEDFAIDAAAQLRQSGHHDWEDKAEPLLALIIAMDQFPRNMYRGTKGAFAFDDLALHLAKKAVDTGLDLKIPQERRAFVYMPFMHSESLLNQDECVRLCDMCLENASSLHHAKEHRKLIRKFGRFPHRNAIFGRESTPEEAAFLASGGYSP
jgi:uncharacterized protein (DUF924 family)